MPRAPKTAAPPTPSNVLRQKLLRLEATKDGFEGLVSALVGAATAGQMRLMSSGDQKGIDSISDPSLGSARRAMQAKRYGEKTKFNLNTLLGEMVRAENAYPDIDVWILPSTKALNGKEAQELTQHAHSLGWSFIALDWTSVSGLPRLAALCATYPDVTLATLPGSDVQRALEAIAADPAFVKVSDTVLNDLHSEEVGLRAAAEHTHAVLNQIYNDPILARKIAGPSPVLLTEAPPVERTLPNKALQRWWDGGKRAAALIGEEGMGKTWQGLQFMRSLATATVPPVIVIIKAKLAETTKDACDAVIEALVEMFASSYTKVADPELLWRRRLHRWTKSKDQTVKVLVLIDGLDELDPFVWEDWLVPLMRSDSASLYRIIMSCRADDWTNRITVAQSYPDLIEVIPLAKFESAERDAYLTARGIEITAVSPKVMQAALHPRTAFHLTRMGRDLPDLNRVTREQLLLRDFQNRWSIKGGLVTGDDFRVLVQNMAKQAQYAALNQKAFTITKGELLDEVVDITGYDKSKMHTVLSDLLSSHWCRRSADDQSKLEFQDQYLPDAVGMALAAEIANKEVGDAQDHLDRFLEPWGADDILEGILRTCATALMIDPKVADTLCLMVLERWFRVPFHNDAGQDFWRRVHIFRPKLMLDFAEMRSQRYYNWLSEWGIACLWQDHPTQRSLVEERLRRWLTHAMLPRFRKHDDAGFERAVNRQYRWQLGRAKVLKRNGMVQWNDAITAVPQAGRNDLPVQAVRAMSFLPRTPLLPLIREWALANGAAGHSHVENNVSALTRWNKHDHCAFVAALRECADTLPSEFGLGVGRRAAAILLRCTGLEEDALCADATFTQAKRSRGHLIQIAGTEIDVAPHSVANRQNLLTAVAPYSGDPDMKLAPTLRAALKPNVDEALQRPGLLYENSDAKFTVERWFARDLRNAVAGHLLTPLPSGAEKVENRELIRRVALLALPGLEKSERKTVGENFGREPEADGRGLPIALAYQLSALAASEQIELVLKTAPAALPKGYERLMQVPTCAEVEALADSIGFAEASDDAHQRLQLLRALLERHDIPGVRANLNWVAAFQQDDRTFAIDAMAVARILDKAGGAAALRTVGWNFLNTNDPVERFVASDLLATLPDAEIAAALPRMQPETLLLLYHQRPGLRSALSTPILEWLKDELLTARKTHSMGGRFMVYTARDTHYATFYASHTNEIDAMLKKAWADKTTRRNVSFSDRSGPVWLLMRLAGNCNPNLAKEIWQGSLSDNRGTYMGDIEVWPAVLIPSPSAEEMRRQMLSRHDTDNHIFNACIAIQAQGKQATLIAEVRRYWQSSMAVQKARALVIAGFLRESTDANALWGELMRPQAGWLQDVYDKAQGHFRAGLHSRHWARVVSQSTNNAEILTAYLLLLENMDDRLIIDPPAFDIPSLSWKSDWLDFLQEHRSHARTENQKTWKDTQLLSEKVNNMVYIDDWPSEMISEN